MPSKLDPQRKPKFKSYKDHMKWRLDRKLESLAARIERVKREYIDQLPDEGTAGEDEREWLDQWAVGTGLDIACGDFLCGDAYGVDGHARMIGTDYWCEGDELTFQRSEGLDFIVTNYLEGFPNPLKALHEWHRTLKPGGHLALVAKDAHSYKPADLQGNKRPRGPLENARRQAAYSQVTLGFYLARAGFHKIKVEVRDGRLWAVAYKK